MTMNFHRKAKRADCSHEKTHHRPMIPATMNTTRVATKCFKIFHFLIHTPHFIV